MKMIARTLEKTPNEAKDYEPLNFNPILRERVQRGFKQLTPSLWRTHPLSAWFHVPDHHPTRSEIMLFRTVLLQAMYDACGGDRDAQSYLLTLTPDLQEVCDMAQTSPLFVGRVTTDLLAGKLMMPDYKVWRYFWARIEVNKKPVS